MAEIVSPKSGKLIKVNSKEFRDLQSDPRYSDSILTEKEESHRVIPSFKRSLLPTLSPIAPVTTLPALKSKTKAKASTLNKENVKSHNSVGMASPIHSASPSLDLSAHTMKVQESIPYPKGLPALVVTSNSPVATRVKSPVATKRVLPPLHVSPKDLGTLAPSPQSPRSPRTSVLKSPKVNLPPLSPKSTKTFSPKVKVLPPLSPKFTKTSSPKRVLPPLSPKFTKTSSPKRVLPPLSPKSLNSSNSTKKSGNKLPPLTSPQRSKRNERSRGWRELSPKPGPERKELKENCGSVCFLRPEDNGYPICRKIKGEAACQVERKGVQAALSRAKQQGEKKVEAKAEVILDKMDKLGVERVRLPALNRNSTLAAKHSPNHIEYNHDTEYKHDHSHVPVIGSPKRFSRPVEPRGLPGLPSPLALGKISPKSPSMADNITNLEEIKTSSCGCGN